MIWLLIIALVWVQCSASAYRRLTCVLGPGALVIVWVVEALDRSRDEIVERRRGGR